MKTSFRTTVVLPASPERIYKAWLNSQAHSEMTGGTAFASDKVGDPFEAWDGYIRGKNLHLEPGRLIVQSWRTTDFPSTQEDSQIELSLRATAGGTRLTLVHSQLPQDQHEEYRKGWRDFYFTPMKRYFAR